MRLSSAIAVALLLSPVAALAQEGQPSGGMPQLDFHNPLTTSQVVWMVLIFAVLYVLLSRWALPQVAVVVEKRAARIAADLETARKAKAEADAAVQELTEATRKAHADAQAEIAGAIAAAKAEAAAQAKEANQRLEAQLQEAEQRIGEARTAAMGALRQVAAETAAAVVGRLTGQTPEPPAVEAAIGRVMTGPAAAQTAAVSG